MSMSKNSDMEIWLREQHMSTKCFCQLVGCSRTVIWKVKNKIPVSRSIANLILILTEGKVSAVVGETIKRKL
jgi:hypothetical protein